MRSVLAATTFLLLAAPAVADHDPSRLHFDGTIYISEDRLVENKTRSIAQGHMPRHAYTYIAPVAKITITSPDRVPEPTPTTRDPNAETIERCKRVNPVFDPTWLGDGRFDAWSCKLDGHGSNERSEPAPEPAPAPEPEPVQEEPQQRPMPMAHGD